MRRALLLLSAGVASATLVTNVPLLLIVITIFIFILSMVFLLTVLFKVPSHHRGLVGGLLLYSLGVFWHLDWANGLLEKRLPTMLEGETLQVEGVVIGLPERSMIAQRFHFEIRVAPAGFFPRKVVLNYYGDATIVPGQYWRFTVRLNRPHGFSNPGGFDYEAWLFQQGISARGYVRDSVSNQLLTAPSGEARFSLVTWLHSVRYFLQKKLQRMLGDSQYGGLLMALLLGDRSAISQDSWRLFTATGSNHLFVISGLHIGMISGFAFWLALAVSKMLGIGNLVPAQKLAAVFALMAAFGYALLAGFSLPTQRAFIMIAALICSLFWNTRQQMSLRFLLAVFAVLLINPLALTNSGFWFSFIAVASLLAFSRSPQASVAVEEIEKPNQTRVSWTVDSFVRPQLIVFIALAVPLIFFTQQLSLLAPLVNIFAIPVVGLLIVPICFLSLLVSFVNEAAAILMFDIAHGVISLLIRSMEFFVGWGSGSVQLQLTQPNKFHVLLLFFVVLLLLLPTGVCRRGLVVPLLLCVLPMPEYLRALSVEDIVLRLHVVDVGQGLAVIVQTRQHALLYDTGANLSPDFNIGSAIVVPTLRALGIHSLAAVIVSHGDNDHAGGLVGIDEGVNIERLISNRRDLDAGLSAEPCLETNDWNWDGVAFRFLKTGVDYSSENNSSCVLQIASSAGSVLLPGDIEREAELRLARDYGDELASSVLIVPHHGSSSSSSYAFLKRVQAKYAVFSAGYRNSFGHPHDQVVERYGEFVNSTLLTSKSGMISFEFTASELSEGETININTHRKQNLRYWH